MYAHARDRQRGQASGITLVELMITLSIAAIVLTFGVSGFRTLIAYNKMTNATNSLIAHLQFARSEAVKRSADVSLCPSTDGVGCVEESDGSLAVGYIVKVDSTGEVIRRVDGKEMEGISATKNRPTSPITFGADGSAGGTNCTITICDPGDSDNKRGILVSNIGRVRVSDYGSGGEALSCP